MKIPKPILIISLIFGLLSYFILLFKGSRLIKNFRTFPKVDAIDFFGLKLSLYPWLFLLIISLLQFSVSSLLLTKNNPEQTKKHYIRLIIGSQVLNFIFVTYFLQTWGSLVMLFSIFLIAPFILSLGIEYSINSYRSSDKKSIPFLMVRLFTSVIASGSLIIMMYYPWPLYLAFKYSESSLNELANQVEKNEELKFPRWAGCFFIWEGQLDNGNVGLILIKAPGNQDGFRRDALGPWQEGPFYNLNGSVKLSDRWHFQFTD